MQNQVSFKQHVVQPETTLKQALERLELLSPVLILFVVNDTNVLTGVLTDGDIRRGLTSGVPITDPILSIMNSDFRYINADTYSVEEIVKARKDSIYLVPILNKEMHLVSVLNLNSQKSMLPLDAVIMAGGKGMRLRPLTDTVPKPLLPVGGKPIIKYNIDLLERYGIKNTKVSVNYLADKIREFFDSDTNQSDVNILEELIPLGTLGSITLAESFIHEDILVMNSDILTTIDLENFYLSYKQSGSDMAVAAIPYNVEIPYGVMETDNNNIVSIKEKPTYTYYANGGIYIIKKSLIEKLAKDQHLDTPDFISMLIEQGKKVTYFPVLNYWLDIGKHEDYIKAANDVKQLVF